MSNLSCFRFCFRLLTRIKNDFVQVRNFSVAHRTTSDDGNSNKTTHFGFEAVSEKEKEEKVYQVFHNVAEKYDLMNDVMSAGIHRLWKDYFIERMSPMKGTQLLDVAGGTGDVAFRFLQYVKNSAEGEGRSEAHVTVLDINRAMLDVGQKKATDLGCDAGVSWIQGNAECLPFDESSFDAYTVAFGIRNMTHINKVLSEAFRVLRHGGRFMCLEFSRVPNPILRSLYDEYSFQVIPVMGHLVAGDWKSYQYLVESIRKFPDQEDFRGMIRDTGFVNVTYENLLLGVSAIHSGFKL